MTARVQRGWPRTTLVAVGALMMMVTLMRSVSASEIVEVDALPNPVCPALPDPVVVEPELKMAVLFPGEIGDLGWSYAGNQGRLSVQTRLRERVRTTFKIMEDSEEHWPEIEDQIREWIADGYKLIVGHSFNFQWPMHNIATTEHPDVNFLHISGFLTSDNMSVAFARIYQARYLSKC